MFDPTWLVGGVVVTGVYLVSRFAVRAPTTDVNKEHNN
jgi:hypothetical protein